MILTQQAESRDTGYQQQEMSRPEQNQVPVSKHWQDAHVTQTSACKGPNTDAGRHKPESAAS